MKFYQVTSGIALVAAIGFSIVSIIQVLHQRELQKVNQQSLDQLLSKAKVEPSYNPQLLQELQQYSTPLELRPFFDIHSPQSQIILGFLLAAVGGQGFNLFLEKTSQGK